MRVSLFPAFLLAAAVLSKPAAATEFEAAGGVFEFTGFVAADSRTFFETPAFDGQLETFQPSFIIEPELSFESDSGKNQFSLKPFFRFDGEDAERTHFDLREAFYRRIEGDFEFLIGFNTVFWGVTESRHLVNIINQIDAVEDTDEEDFLGQQQVNLAIQKDWGRIDLFLLPGFRERTFPGTEGRLRTEPITDDDVALFERDLGQAAIDTAVRYSHFFGDFDLGLSYFFGTSREATLIPDPASGSLLPLFERIHQGGVDLQYTKDEWLLKFEGIVRAGQGETFVATVGGFEYTVFQVADTDADWGLLAEHLFDSRDTVTSPGTALENDLFLGTRLTLNDVQDTDFLAGTIIDLSDGTTSFRVEADRRIGDTWTVELEAQFLVNVDEGNTLAPFEQDSFINLKLSKFF